MASKKLYLVRKKALIGEDPLQAGSRKRKASQEVGELEEQVRKSEEVIKDEEEFIRGLTTVTSSTELHLEKKFYCPVVRSKLSSLSKAFKLKQTD